eukprot:Pgem_evm1s5615
MSRRESILHCLAELNRLQNGQENVDLCNYISAHSSHNKTEKVKSVTFYKRFITEELYVLISSQVKTKTFNWEELLITTRKYLIKSSSCCSKPRKINAEQMSIKVLNYLKIRRAKILTANKL